MDAARRARRCPHRHRHYTATTISASALAASALAASTSSSATECPSSIAPATLAGAPTGFSMRGMPALLKHARQHGAPVHRVVDSAWTTIPRHLPDQRALLEAEGVRVCAESGRLLDARAVAWAPDHGALYLCEPKCQEAEER